MTRQKILLPLLLTALCLLAGASAARAQGEDHRAGLVIRYADGSVQTQCVSFSEPSITGEELLQRSGLAVTLDYNAGLGGAVCSINNQGCAYPITDCFCQCQGDRCEYWAYYHRADAGWQYASTGASSYQVADGALEGWSWGPGNFFSGTEPPLLTFAEVCPAQLTTTPTATATATPTNTATATPTATTAVSQSPFAPPEVTFEAQATELAAGGCTTLRWSVSDASSLTLNGTPVSAQDQRQVCPSATQRFILAALNAAGQTVREIVVTVFESSPVPGTVQPTSTATRTPAAAPSATPGIGTVLTPTAPPVLLAATAAVAPTPDTRLPATTEPPLLGLAGIAVAHAQELAPAPSAPPPHEISSDAVSLLVAAATPTPRPRRQLGADGRPTPTPILLAYAQPPGSAGRRPDARLPLDSSRASVASQAPDRDFSLALLPGYAAYLLTLACLAGAGVWVARRKLRVLRKS